MRSARALLALVTLLLPGCFGETGEQGPTASTTAPTPSGEPAAIDGCVNQIEYSLGEDWGLIATCEYSPGGLLRRYVERDREGHELSRVERGYDSLGRRVSQTFDTSRLGSAHRAMTWTWDEQDRVTQLDVTDLSTQVTSRTTYQYGPHGRLERLDSWKDGVLQLSDRYQYTEGEPLEVALVAEYPTAATTSLVRYSFALGRWLSRLSLAPPADPGGMEEIYTYEDQATGRLSRRTLTTDQVTTYEELYEWDAAGRVHRLAWSGTGYDPSSTDFEYDAAGHLVRRRWRIASSPPQEYLTDITWSGDRPGRVERSVAATGELIERWRFTYGCPTIGPDAVPLAPVESFRRELATIPFSLEMDDLIGAFPDAL